MYAPKHNGACLSYLVATGGKERPQFFSCTVYFTDTGQHVGCYSISPELDQGVKIKSCLWKVSILYKCS